MNDCKQHEKLKSFAEDEFCQVPVIRYQVSGTCPAARMNDMMLDISKGISCEVNNMNLVIHIIILINFNQIPVVLQLKNIS